MREELAEYYVVEFENLYDLMNAVNHRMKEGWKLQGGISVTYKWDKIDGNRRLIYCQAITRTPAASEGD